MSDKSDEFKEDDADLLVGAGTVIDIVNHLLQLVLAFVEPERAKQLIDAQVAESVSAEADKLELQKFGKVD